MSIERTRLAPSPTGALHLGNARTFLVNWALARRSGGRGGRGWRVLLRIEDLDTPRTKRGADVAAIDDLGWLGLDWDEGPVYQLTDLGPYHAALRRLGEAGLIYRCDATRTQIAAALSAPHGDEHELRYPGINRPAEATPVEYEPGDQTLHPQRAQRRREGEGQYAWRLRVPDEAVAFDDAVAGAQAINVQQTAGDFVVATKAGLPAYQLAVVVDDARQGVTQVVRGDDLLASTARQMLLYRMLGLGPPPRYTHLPLVIGPDGRRLAKRHGDTRLSAYRERGVPPERVVGLIAHWCGLGGRRAMTAAQFTEAFDLANMRREAVVFTDDDERWLTAG